MPEPSEWLLDPHRCPGFQRAEVAAHVERPPVVHHTEHLWVHLPRRYGLVSIHDQVEEVLRRSGVRDGLCFAGASHITAGVYVNDAEGGLLQDIARWIEALAPYGRPYLHHETGEDNCDAHLKSFLTNHAAILPVTAGELDLGPWQRLFYAEYDGRRAKRIVVKMTGVA